MLWLVYSFILVLNLCDFSETSAFTPPRPRKGLGFQLPLNATPLMQRRTGPQGAVETLANICVFNAREFAYLVHISLVAAWVLAARLTASHSVGDQNLTFTLDTGSSDLWVASSDCKDSDCQAVQTYHKSSTLSRTQTPFRLKYVQGSVLGTIGYEIVTLGQVEIHKQVIGIVTNVSSINLSSVSNSGILGLAFPRSSTIPHSAGKTLLENVYDVLDENSRFFAFQLGRGSGPSSFTIGQVDLSTTLSNLSLSYFPVYPANAYTNVYDYWKLPLHHIRINGRPLPFPLSRSRVEGTDSPIAILDTGTSLILGPTKDVDMIWQTVGGATREPNNGLWMVRCDRNLSVSLVFGGIDGVDMREYYVHPRDLSWGGTPNETLCLAGIQGNDKVISGDWLLGDAFLRNVYATHHAATMTAPPLIGLAGLNDPEDLSITFHTEYGQDTSAVNLVPERIPSRTRFLLFSAVVGFTGGLLAILALKINICWRVLRTKRYCETTLYCDL